MKIQSALCLGLLTLGSAGNAAALDAGTYMGSFCRFASNPSATHNYDFHKLNNTSGSTQWVTCPLVRRTPNNVQDAAVFVTGNAFSHRFEQRSGNGTVTGWSPDDTIASGGGWKTRYFQLADGAPISGASFAIVLELANGASVSSYSVTEQ